MNRADVPAPLSVVGLVALCALAGCFSGSAPPPGNPQDGATSAIGGSTGAVGVGGSTAGGAGGRVSGTGGRTGGQDAGAGVGGSGAAGASGAGGASSGCYAIVSQILPSSVEVESGTKGHVRVQGTPIGASSPVMWQWSVMFIDLITKTTTAIMPTAFSGAGAIIDFPVLATGSYSVTALITSQPGCRAGFLTVTAVDPGPMKYLLRASASGFPVQDTEFPLNPTDPQPMASLALREGTSANLLPQRADMNGGPLLSYIRITDMGSGVSVDGDTSRGAGYLFSTPDGLTWTQTHKFVASDGTTDDFLGAAAAYDGQTAILSSPHPVINGHAWQGAADFYARDTLFTDGFDG